jgi:thioredoxin-like negative regulator of GroEL
LRAGNFTEALSKMQTAALKKSTSKLAKLGEAEALVGLGHAQEALKVYENLAMTWPNDSRIRRRLEILRGARNPIAPQTPPPLATKSHG